MTSKYIWKLEKYAVFEGSDDNLNGNDVQAMLRENNSTDKWSVVDDSNGQSKLSLIYHSSNNLVVISNNSVLENISMMVRQKWTKGLVNQDSMFFIWKYGDKIRRFRVKFASNEASTSIEQCKHCFNVLMTVFPLRICGDGDNATEINNGLNDSSANEISLKEIVDHLLNKKTNKKLELVCSSMNRDQAFGSVDQSQIEQILLLTLTDPTFPSFVGHVERALKSVIKGSEIDASPNT